jgi:UDPglucose 6-dehydrogenase
MDRRIGSKFLHAGPGYGGSCFPKDTHALSAFARSVGVTSGIVDATIRANQNQMDRMVEKIARAAGRSRARIGVLGLSFKPNTDDLRAAPALHIIAALRGRGYRVTAFDPVAMPRARASAELEGVAFARDAYEAARGADALAIVTEWNEFRNLNLARLRRLMRKPVLCDLRNLYDPEEVEAAGMRHVGVGRGRPPLLTRGARKRPRRAAAGARKLQRRPKRTR